MSFKFKKPEDSPGFLLWHITHHWQRLQRDALIKLHITHAQFVVLACLLWCNHENKNNITQQYICELSGIDKMSLSDLIATLEKKKLVKKIKSKSDKRAFVLSLTATGKKTAIKAVPMVEKIDRDFFHHQTAQLKKFLRLVHEISV